MAPQMARANRRRELTGWNAAMNARETSKVRGELRDCLRALFDAALAAADPARAIAQHLPQPVAGRTIVVGAGKASAAMARAFEMAWPGPLDGVVVTRH